MAEAEICPECGVRQDVASLTSEEKHCTHCGEVVDIQAEICPECGVRQETPLGGSARSQKSPQSSNQSVRTDIGVFFALEDMLESKKGARHLIDLILIFITFGTYLAIMAIEWLNHYYKLKKGVYPPFNPELHEEVWSPLFR